MAVVVKQTTDLLDFAAPVMINMVDRPRRLRSSLAELRRATGRANVDADDLHLIRPGTFTDAAGFANAGYRSNLDAHLQAARWALQSGHERVLVMEDDLAFTPTWNIYGLALLQRLDHCSWDLASLGYLDTYGEAPLAPLGGWTQFSGKVNGAHAYLINRPGMQAWADHLGAVAEGEPGDDLQGPMASDGAINTFCWVDPTRIRLVATPNMVGTRQTRSDINPSFLDRVPVVGSSRELARTLLRRSGRGRINC